MKNTYNITLSVLIFLFSANFGLCNEDAKKPIKSDVKEIGKNIEDSAAEIAKPLNKAKRKTIKSLLKKDSEKK